MKKVAFILVCVLGVAGFTSCKSSAPCGLSANTDQIQYDGITEVLVSEATE